MIQKNKYTIIKLILIGLTLSSLASCKEFYNFFRSKGNRSQHTTVPFRISGRDSSEIKEVKKEANDKAASVIKRKEKEDPRLVKWDSLDAEHGKMLQALADNEDKSLSIQEKSDMAQKLQQIWGKRDATRIKFEELKKSREEISAFLQPENIEKNLDNFLDGEVKKFLKLFPGKDPPIDSLIVASQRFIDSLIEERVEAFLLNTQSFGELIKEENTTAWQIITYKDNAQWDELYSELGDVSFFESGEHTLPDSTINRIRRNLNLIFDTLTTQVRANAEKFSSDTVRHVIMINIYIEGYADSEPYRDVGPEESDRLNEILSLHRAEYISSIVKEVAQFRISQDITQYISFSEPVIKIIGLGQKKPDPNGNYEDEGEEDPKRRRGSLRFIITVDY